MTSWIYSVTSEDMKDMALGSWILINPTSDVSNILNTAELVSMIMIHISSPKQMFEIFDIQLILSELSR